MIVRSKEDMNDSKNKEEMKKVAFKLEETLYFIASVCSKKVIMFFLLILLLGSVTFIWFTDSKISDIALGDEELIQISSAPVSAVAERNGTIVIPKGMVKSNPFLPYRNIDPRASLDVPSFDLVEPPEVLDEGSEAARVMDTIVSGILYDKYSPSAILNIEGSDYLVKKGDVVNNYKVLSIVQDSVTVKLGNNVYKAGIGEILTEGSLNHNDVSNLNNKFGGVQ